MKNVFFSIVWAVATLCGVSFAATDTALVIESPQVVYTDANMPIGCFDIPVSYLRKSDTTFDVFHCGSWASEMFLYEGTLDMPFSTRQGDPTINLNGWYTDWFWAFPWIMSIYKIATNELLAFNHIEKMTCGPAFGCDYYATGISYSSDNGRSWTFCGEIAKSKGDKKGANMGGIPYIVVGEYFYIYFNEGGHPAVARAIIDDVINAARNKTVGTWMKYNNGSWNQNGLTGAGSEVIRASSGTRLDTHGKAAYIKSIQKYIICLNAQSAHAFHLYTSTDGINWENETILQEWDDGMCPYGSFAGLGDASEDCHELGDEFYVYWTHKTSDYCNDTYYRSRITVKGGGKRP